MIQLRKLLPVMFIVTLALIAGSCYYDNEEYLYPITPGCDTTSVTYSGTIIPIMSQNCNVCHNTATASGGVITDTYEGLKTVGLNGRLIGAVSHAQGFSPMPKGGNKLSDCTIQKIQKWVDSGCPQN